MRDGAALCSPSVAEGWSGPRLARRGRSPSARSVPTAPLSSADDSEKNPAEPPQIINSADGALGVCDSLCCRVVELILAGAAEAGLHTSVLPEPLDDTGQLGCHEALLC